MRIGPYVTPPVEPPRPTQTSSSTGAVDPNATTPITPVSATQADSTSLDRRQNDRRRRQTAIKQDRRNGFDRRTGKRTARLLIKA